MSEVDLDGLPDPDGLQTLSFSETRDAWLAALDDPDLAASAVPGDLVTEVSFIGAFREINARAEINDQIKGTFLALSYGDALDLLGSQLELTRTPGATDDEHRDAIHGTPRTIGTGSRRRYELEAEAAHFAVYEARAIRESAAVVGVYWAPTEESILAERLAAQAAILARLSTGVDADGFEVRMMTDQIQVTQSTMASYLITAHLHLEPGPDPDEVLAIAIANLDAVVAITQAPNQRVSRSEIMAALHVNGVAQVDLTDPVADVAAAPDFWRPASAITITHEVATWLR